MKIATKHFEIFCGTGGVGKTTLATSRAFELSTKNLRVLLITIDPARRLKDLLSLSEENVGEVCAVELKGMKLHALLMSPEKTIERMSQNYQTPDLANNRIVKILSRPYGGMNEILSLVEVQMQFETNQYDVIVLDTPPGAHFLDFLEGMGKIKTFFDQSFIDIFSYIGSKTTQTGKKIPGMGLIGKVISGGLKKLLGQLQKVTDAKFIDDFIVAVQVIYESKNAFLKGLELQERMKTRSECNWFLVTSVEQGKAQEAIEMKSHAKQFIHQDHFLVLNKCLQSELESWNPLDENLLLLKDSLYIREKELKEELNKSFETVLEFPEIMSLGPEEHVLNLITKWNSYVL